MKEFLLYIIQSTICLSFFGAVYILFLRKQTFFRFNRIFLLIGLMLSFIIPSIDITYDVVVPSIVKGMDMLNVTANEREIVKDGSINIWQVLGIIYITGIIFFIVRNVRILINLNRLKNTGKSSIVDSCNLIEHTEIKTPFSIFNSVFINTLNLQNREKDIILKHEISHVKQKHWFDLLCSEGALLLQWFNPLLWYYVHLQKENHEYLADQAVLNDGESIAVYRAVLINQRFQGPVFSFANSFNYLNQQNRLTMMKKTKTSPWKKIAVLAVLPLFGAFFALSAKPNYVVENENDSPQKKAVSSKESIDQRIANLSKDSITLVGVVNGEVIAKSVAPIDSKDEALLIIDGEESTMAALEKIRTNDIGHISVIKDKSAIEIYGEKAKGGVILVTTKKTNTQTVSASSTKSEDGGKAKISVSHNIKDALLIIDGKEAIGKTIKDINEDDIQKMEVFKGDNAIEKYGQKGSNGVILITTKQGSK